MYRQIVKQIFQTLYTMDPSSSTILSEIPLQGNSIWRLGASYNPLVKFVSPYFICYAQLPVQTEGIINTQT